MSNIGFAQIFIAKKYKNISSLRTIGLIVMGICLSSLIIAIMFTLQNWAGAFLNFIISIISLVIIGIIAFIKWKHRTDEKFYKSILFRIVGWVILGICVLFF